MNIVEKLVKRVWRKYLSESNDNKMLLQGLQIQELKRQLKNMRKDKIKVVFVCHRPAVWDALKTVYEACMEDEMFDVTIVAIPNKIQLPKLGFAHEEYKSEGAEEFFMDYPCKVINGYNYDTKTWLNLESLEPDYLFFQTPYDICRPPEYQSNVVAMFTKLCQVHYGMPFMDGFIAEESFPVSFLRNTYFHFAEYEEMRKYYVDRVDDNPVHKKNRVVLTGYPKLDAGKRFIGCDDDNWNYHDSGKRYRVMWTPRWNTEENSCTFFDYKDLLVDYITNNQKTEMLFRPHPQAFNEFISRKQMTEAEVTEYKNKYKNADNLNIDNKQEYLSSFYSSDVLITDESSIIPEYFLTGKPIIFTYKETHLNEFARKIAEGFYWAKDWDEVKGHLDMLLAGKDEKKEQREKLIAEAFYLPEKGAGYEIKETLKKDFLGDNAGNV